jgi:nitroreductase
MIDAAIEVAAQSPSACNRQPFQFRVFDDPQLVQKVAELPMGTAGYAHNIPVMIVIVGQQRNYFDERDRHLIYIDSSLAAMGMVYALEAQGLSSCCINWPDVESREAALAKLLQLDPDERAVMCLAVGYPDPDGLVAYSQKKPVDQLRRFNFE